MSRRFGLVGLAVVCAMALSAVVASGASASGVTAYTCVAGQGTLNADCEVGSSGTSGHVAIAAGTNTGLKLTAHGNSVLSAILAGAEVTLTATGVECIECMAENKEVTATEMDVTGSGGRILYTGITTNAPNCKPEEPGKGLGTVTTEPLKFTAKSTASTVLSPVSGTTLAKIKMVSSGGTCSLAGKTFEVKGTATGSTNGSILSVNTGVGELTIAGEEAFLVGSATVTAGVTGGTFGPIALTAS